MYRAEDVDTWQPTGLVGRRGGANQAGFKVCREESLDTSVHTGREEICGGDIYTLVARLREVQVKAMGDTLTTIETKALVETFK